MVNERLIWWAEHTKKVHVTQNGFRRGKSCLDNLGRLLADIRTGIHEDSYSLAAFLDVTAAYDNVDLTILREHLCNMGCPKKILDFLNKWLSTRETEFIISDTESRILKVSKGLPQRVVLSPLLYALYTRLIANDIGVYCKILQFADDIVIYTIGKNREINRRNLEDAVNRVAQKLVGLNLEPKKTNLVEFSKAGWTDKNMYIKIANVKVFNTNNARFLGIDFDSRTNFKAHIQQIRGRMKRANAVVKYLCRVSWGVEVNTALMLYKSMVRSVSDYGSFIYAPTDKEYILKLERGQYAGIRTALGYRNSTPNNVIIAEAKVTLLKDMALMLARNWCLKNYKYGDLGVRNSMNNLIKMESLACYRNPLYKKSMLGRAWKDIKNIGDKVGNNENTYEIWQMDYAVLTEDLEIDLEFGKEYQDREKTKERYVEGWIMNEEDRKMRRRLCTEKNLISSKTEMIYTDGSKPKGAQATGAGIASERREIAYYVSLPSECSSFTAEAFAIKSALEIELSKLDKGNLTLDNYCIMSDCQAVIKAVHSNTLNVYVNKYILDIKNLVYKLKHRFNKRTIMVWILSHRGIAGNEVADQLAKDGAKERPAHEIEVPIHDIRSLNKERAYNDTQQSIEMDARFKGQFYFDNYYKKHKRKPWFHNFNAERYYITLLNRLRSNHYNLNESLARKGYVDSERCECGGEREDIDHVIWSCHKYDDLREKLGIELSKRRLEGRESIFSLIEREQWEKIDVIFTVLLKNIGKII
ncbi:PREDICTED: uncharacterized protein LOC105462596 [Wasmannia auropunctata]|uniref:uncharacterized protein LOC105462596 n=1 Tax=Wasmannia auropunctata TaxID=64793 RepID=UPI0005F05773|nr:PREDICTED: uncharacterized protein LOC105462596 [Wasmannia auropunctata]